MAPDGERDARTVRDRQSLGYTLAMTVTFAGLIAYISSIQQIIFEVAIRCERRTAAAPAAATTYCFDGLGAQAGLVEGLGARRHDLAQRVAVGPAPAAPAAAPARTSVRRELGLGGLGVGAAGQERGTVGSAGRSRPSAAHSVSASIAPPVPARASTPRATAGRRR